jgi:hypothetical protein
MQRVAPSQIARQQLQELLAGGAECGSNIVSALVETVTRVVVQELLEAARIFRSRRAQLCHFYYRRDSG